MPKRYPMLKKQITAYFRENPDEELTMWDIAVKFNAPLNCVKSRVREMWQPGGELKRHCLIRKRHPDDWT